MNYAALARRLDGHDGSHWQPDAGPVNLQVMRDAGIWSLIWKATQSVKYKDPTFGWIRDQARAVGFRHFMSYHWLSSTTDITSQAMHHLRTVDDIRDGEGVMLDAEEAGITEDGCVRWCEEIEEVIGRPCAVYTGLYVAGGTIWRSERVRNSKFGPRPMHLAAYVSVANLTSRAQALRVTHLPIHAWQWSSNGPVPGITGRADMNQILDRDIYDLACAVRGAAPVEPKPPIKKENDLVDIITNAEPYGDTPARQIKWALMPDGTKRHLSLEEWQARGSDEGRPLPWAVTNALPDWTPPAAAAAPEVRSLRISGTIEGLAQPS